MALEVLRYPDGQLTTGAWVDTREHYETGRSDAQLVLKIEVVRRKDFNTNAQFDERRYDQIQKYMKQLGA